MLKEWADSLPSKESVAVFLRQEQLQFERRLAALERAIGMDVAAERIVPTSFHDAMRHFLALRQKLFPGLPADPVWQILITLAREPELGANTSVTSIAYGAEVPLTTALRYIAALEIEGVVERVPCSEDKRRVFIRLTDDGRRRLDAVASQWATRMLWVLAIPCLLLTMVW